MISQDKLFELARKYKINESTILREYVQLYFLSRLYSIPESKKIFFKGGTAIHFIYHSPRFSQDLDFTVEETEKKFLDFIYKFFSVFKKEEPVEFKERKTIAGKRFLLTYTPSLVGFKVFINLDFSFREKILLKDKFIITTDFPVVFRSYIYHTGKNELLAEKIRALLTRAEGRDIYDIWYLLSQKGEINEKIILEKLRYYKIKTFNKKDIFKKLDSFAKKDFILDLRPFVSINEREKLGDFFDYLKDYIRESL